MHYFSFHIGDYASHTRHLSLIEDLAYRRLLDHYYMTETPIAESTIARLIGMGDYAKEVLQVLHEFFIETDYGFVSKRADIEIAAYRKLSEGGKRGAAKRWAKDTDSHPITTIKDSDSNPNAIPLATINQEPRTKNQEPNNSVPKGTGDGSPEELTDDEKIFVYGLPLLTNAGTAEKQARSFLGGLKKANGAEKVVEALRQCYREKPLQPLEWLAACLPMKGKKTENFASKDYGTSGNL